MSRLILRYPLHRHPFVALLTGNFLNITNNKEACQVVSKKDQPAVTLTFIPQGDVIIGEEAVARYFARLVPSFGLHGGEDIFVQSQVDQWIDETTFYLDSRTEESVLNYFNSHLAQRTFFVVNQLTLADFAVWAFLKRKNVEVTEKTAHLSRWLQFVETLTAFQEVLKLLPKPEEKKGPSAGSRGVYDELEGAVEGKVVTRFPPEPSGFLHIGHAKAALLNYHYAQKYKGKMLLRFDDTNPVKEKEEYVENILSDINTLGIKYEKITYTSDHFDKLIEYCETLLKKGDAYADNSLPAETKLQREEGTESPARKQTVEENLAIWDQMKKGTEKGKTYIIRAKINMQHHNRVMRDPAIYRCVDTPHHRVGTKYKVYPLYDFACPVVDSIEGVTHALRSSEYHDHNDLYYWVLEATGIRRVTILDFSRLGFANTVLSKRKLQWFVDNKYVEGWNDPSFPTVQGILRRGLTLEALQEFIISQGASKSVTFMEPDKLWALNKKIIDPVIPRYTTISQNSKVQLKLTNGPTSLELKTVAKHKKNASLGIKGVIYTNTVLLEYEDSKDLKVGEEITLMDWGNVIVRGLEKQDDKVTGVTGELHLEGSVKDTEKRLTWIADVEDNIPVIIRDFGNLLLKKKLDKGEDFEKFANKNVKIETFAIGEPALKEVSVGTRLQLTRVGYFICDAAYHSPSSPLVLVQIPEGKKGKEVTTA